MSKLRGKSPKLAKPSRPQVLIFGPPGVGKTWQTLDFPNCYFIDCEGGANLPHYTQRLDDVGAIYLGPEDGANDYSVVLQEVIALATTKHDRKTLVIDSFTKLFQTAVQVEYERILKAGKKPEFGIEKKPAISYTRRLIRWLNQIDMNVILICHERPEWVKGEQIGTTFDGHEKLGYELNLVLQIFKNGKSRKARCIKTRFEEFTDGTICDWSYTEFVKRFGSDVMNAEHLPIEVATTEQVATAKRLVGALNIEAGDISKLFDSCGVTKWEDMPSDRIVKAITKLEERLKG